MSEQTKPEDKIMKFFALYDEGSPLQSGFNFYRLSDPTSFGGWLVVNLAKKRYGLQIRKSKLSGKWYFVKRVAPSSSSSTQNKPPKD